MSVSTSPVCSPSLELFHWHKEMLPEICVLRRMIRRNLLPPYP